MLKHDLDFIRAMKDCGEISDDAPRSNIEEMLYDINHLSRITIATEQGSIELLGYKEVTSVIHKYIDTEGENK